MMTPKERWLAAIRMKPVDRLPFWAKLDLAYPSAQTSPFRDMALDEVHAWIGSKKPEEIPQCITEVRKTTSVETHTDNGVWETVFRTRLGSQKLVQRFDVPSNSWHPVQFPVHNRDDIQLMTEFFEDCVAELDVEQLAKATAHAREIGTQALTYCEVGESPLMYWVEWLAGIENAHYLLLDYTQEVEELFEAMHQVLLRRMALISENTPSDTLYLIENTSTTLISPEQYRKYCYRHIQEYGHIAREAGQLLILHMCGQLKALLPYLAELPVAAFEAFTSPTLGDTTLFDGRSTCPDKCLIGGTNAMLWLRPPEEIIAHIEQELNGLPHHRGVVISSAGMMPPLCKPETIRVVCQWVKEYEANIN